MSDLVAETILEEEALECLVLPAPGLRTRNSGGILEIPLWAADSVNHLNYYLT